MNELLKKQSFIRLGEHSLSDLSVTCPFGLQAIEEWKDKDEEEFEEAQNEYDEDSRVSDLTHFSLNEVACWQECSECQICQ